MTFASLSDLRRLTLSQKCFGNTFHYLLGIKSYFLPPNPSIKLKQLEGKCDIAIDTY